MMGVKLVSRVDPQKVQIDAGNSFPNANTTERQKAILFSRDYPKAIWTFFNQVSVHTTGLPKLKVW